MSKICTKCNVAKSLDSFYKNSNHKDGLEYYCKSCKKDYRDSLKNREHKKQINKICTGCNILKDVECFGKCSSCFDGLKQKCKDCRRNDEYLKNREYILNKKRGAEYKKPTSEKRLEYKRRHYLKNKDSINSYRRKYSKERREKDPMFKLTSDTRTLIGVYYRKYISGEKYKNKRTEEILGCSIKEFIEHLETLFTDEMTLENHGNCEECWHIDHIIPISSAKTEEEFYKLNHYTNLQPLWSRDNMKKGSKLT